MQDSIRFSSEAVELLLHCFLWSSNFTASWIEVTASLQKAVKTKKYKTWVDQVEGGMNLTNREKSDAVLH